jgi:uncharacterized protein YbaP (TraB family)
MRFFTKYITPFFLVALLWLTGCGSDEGQTNDPNVDQTVPTGPSIEYGDDHTLLWEITGNGLTAPSYLYGTIHIQDKRVFAYDDVVQLVFDTCEAYAMELLLDEVNPMEQMGMIMMKDTLLSDLVSAEDFAFIETQVKAKLGLMGMKFNEMRPFFTSAQLAMTEIPSDMDTPLDMHLDNQAKSQEKKRIGIEQFADQMAAINSISLEEQANMLVEGMRDSLKTLEQFDKMMEAYLGGDLDAMLELTKDTAYPDDFVVEFLNKRNVHMAERIDEITHEQTTFNAVGAGHLGGPEGVIALLRARGFTVKPVKTAFQTPE